MNRILDGPICNRGNDLIAFLYNEMDENAARSFEQHALSCTQCESELQAFKQIRSSVVAWRQESLGGVPATSVAAYQVGTASELVKPSAIAAIQEFFKLSPLWMKGAIAFASVLFCVVSLLSLAHLFENPKPGVLTDGKRYTEKELQARIEDAVKSRLTDQEAQTRTLLSSVAANDNVEVRPRTKGISRSSVRAANPKVGRGPLTKSEREQLAADLRLTTAQEETELELLDDGINPYYLR